ncbi:hypothetical protein Q7A53_11960 [Halobacillus rhizosphaerae]|uniref:hypothetical protein n=1 Tax=Halobacillus rhizosphaerae TaxID=3064889 RepID=UPI00398B49A5
MKTEEKELIVHQVVREIYDAYPDLLDKFGENGRLRTEEDNYHHLNHLVSAYEMRNIDFFIDYTLWLNTLLTSRGVGTPIIIDNFERLVRLLKQNSLENEEECSMCIDYLKESLQKLRTL